jgi:hypothetical protein
VNKPGRPPVFKYTSHSWLLDLFFNCPHSLGTQCDGGPPDVTIAAAAEHTNASSSSSGSGSGGSGGSGRRKDERVGSGATPDYHPQCVVCPTAAEVKAVEDAIHADVITWHAFPFNAEPGAYIIILVLSENNNAAAAAAAFPNDGFPTRLPPFSLSIQNRSLYYTQTGSGQTNKYVGGSEKLTEA